MDIKTSSVASKPDQVPLSVPPYVPRLLRYVEWVSLLIPALRMLFPIYYQPLGYEAGISDFLAFCVLGVLGLLSLYFPVNRSLWERRGYIWLEIASLLATRLYSHWGFDLLLYLVLIKCWFLLSKREAIATTILSGILWQIALTKVFIDFISQAKEMQAYLEYLQSTPLSLQLFDAILNSTTVFICANILITLLCLIAISEYKSRQREAALAKEVEVLAADLERTRIAREIHDSLGHTLTSLDVQLELAQRLYERNPVQVRQALDTSKMLSSQALQEVRRSVTALREGSFDLNTALISLINQFQFDPAITIRSNIDLPRLPLQVSHQIYCIVKEGLENIRRHSHAKSIHLLGQYTPGEVCFTLTDDGVGFDPTQAMTGFGLRGMRERVQLIGGEFTIESAPELATSIRFKIPIPP